MCSFQRVTCALLRLVTLPAVMNSVLTQCYNPILATVADNLDMQAVSQSVRLLAAQGSIADPHFIGAYEVGSLVKLCDVRQSRHIVHEQCSSTKSANNSSVNVYAHKLPAGSGQRLILPKDLGAAASTSCYLSDPGCAALRL